ncbi:hypothetical protein PIB30_000863 [Stylosanthes scabra]|uniref:Uncharacterized protein n=1 Tax=Stylosanthes scabra TaxID=79078 RepID=A0ABU6R319_9FABA|nr:hypothetical protein [Stylosanthes scabra]
MRLLCRHLWSNDVQGRIHSTSNGSWDLVEEFLGARPPIQHEAMKEVLPFVWRGCRIGYNIFPQMLN